MSKINWPRKGRDAEEPGSILIGFVLDKSGSMETVRAATIDGFNEFITDQVAHPGDAYLTLAMFDESYYLVAEAVPLREMPAMTPGNYTPSGCTALYDAMARTMSVMQAQVDAMTEKPDQVLLVVMTDGLENASREFTRQQVFEMVNERRAAGWEVLYLGANQDSYAEGATVGVAPAAASNWEQTDVGQRANYKRASRAVARMRTERLCSMPAGELELRPEDFDQDEAAS